MCIFLLVITPEKNANKDKSIKNVKCWCKISFYFQITYQIWMLSPQKRVIYFSFLHDFLSVWKEKHSHFVIHLVWNFSLETLLLELKEWEKWMLHVELENFYRYVKQHQLFLENNSSLKHEQNEKMNILPFYWNNRLNDFRHLYFSVWSIYFNFLSWLQKLSM